MSHVFRGPIHAGRDTLIQRMRIALVGGGTGGHFYPLMAIAESLRAHDAREGSKTELLYLGPDPYRAEALHELNIRFVYVPAGKQRLYSSWSNIIDLLKTGIGLLVAFVQLLILYPDAVMSKGGYTSVPVVLAAWLLRIPIVIHESDAVPGRANLWGARFARYIAIAHDDAATFFDTKKTALVGMPIRSSFFTKRDDPYSILGIPRERPVILVTGGSLGAERINNLVLESLAELLPHYTVLHQTGEANLARINATAGELLADSSLLSGYFTFGHMDHESFAAAQDAADLIVSRAGSGTIFEIALKGKPAIIIPIPEEISRDQRTNAYAYARSGGASVLEEHNLTKHLFTAEIHRILDNHEIYSQMRDSAGHFTVATGATTLAGILIGIGKEHE